MKKKPEYDLELLRPYKKLMEPDPRNARKYFFSTSRRKKNKAVKDHYGEISEIRLQSYVPKDIQICFDTARNLYVYAWYIYRFFSVAESHVLACLELALRERFRKEIPKSFFKKTSEPTLPSFICYAVDIGAIRKELFPDWHIAAKKKAESRYRIEKTIEAMETRRSVTLDYNEAEIENCDRSYDPIKCIVEHFPGLRNHYAHGSKMINPQVLKTFALVAEMINQIYSPEIK